MWQKKSNFVPPMKTTVISMGALLLLLASCGGKKDKEGEFPAAFATMGDTARTAWMIEHVPADSLARFIIDASIGKVEGAKIDTLAIATNYAFEHLKGEDLDKFSIAYDSYVESLPLADKMRVYAQAGTEDPQGLGYRLGLEYMSNIRDHKKSADEVERELKAFRKACGADTATYRRFLVGFKTVLKVDKGVDVPADIYNRFINYN